MSHLVTFHELKKAYISRRLGESESETEKNDQMNSSFLNFIEWLSGSFLLVELSLSPEEYNLLQFQ